jgi:hypothetical protein
MRLGDLFKTIAENVAIVFDFWCENKADKATQP